MDNEKKAGFVKMARRQKFSKGGLIRKLGDRHYFDGGGTVLSGPGTVGGNSSQTVNNHGLIGTIGNALGMNNQFQAQGANIQQGTNAEQLNQAYQGAQSGINQQQDYANQLASQGAQGMGSQSYLTGQLQGMINGTGPNPAQAALAQNTANNVQQTAAMAAGQRGAGANTGLIARQAAMAGSQAQQSSIGQAATLQAQQQIAAQQQLQSLAASQVGQQGGAIQGVNQTQQNEQNILQGANTAANNAAVTMQSNINNANAQVAAGNQQQAGNLVGKVLGGASAALGFGGGFSHGGEVPHMASGGPLVVAPMAQSGVVSTPWLNSQPVQGGAPSAGTMANIPLPTLPTTMSAPKKEKTEKKEEVKPEAPVPNDYQEGSAMGDMAQAMGSPEAPGTSMGDMIGASMGPGVPHEAQGGMMESAMKMIPILAMMDEGGNVHPHHLDMHFQNYYGGGKSEKVPAMVSPGEVYLSPEKVRQVVEEGKNPLKIGERFKGKAKVKGDSLKNDTLPKTLEEGGVVIPRHVMNKMSPEKAELFVHRAIARKKVRG